MEQRYWLGREQVSLANAKAAIGGQARLIHYDLAGRYSIKAADSRTALHAAAGGTY